MIYIKDMDMPADCLGCRISCKHESYMVIGRPEDCPLEEAKTGGLISRADAINAFWDDSDIRTAEVRATLKALPSAEAVQTQAEKCDECIHKWTHKDKMTCKECVSAEAVQGEWVRKYDDKVNCYWYECDQCGEYRPRNQFGHEYNANFCPNCGARMKGGDTE